MDINIYNLHFVLALLGPPQSARYFCRRGFNGVDLSGTVILEYNAQQSSEARLCLCTGAKDTDAPSFGFLQCDNGWLRIEGPVSTMTSITLCLRGQQPQQIPLAPVSHRLAPEFAAFASILHHHDYTTINHLLNHSLALIFLLFLRNVWRLHSSGAAKWYSKAANSYCAYAFPCSAAAAFPCSAAFRYHFTALLASSTCGTHRKDRT